MSLIKESYSILILQKCSAGILPANLKKKDASVTKNRKKDALVIENREQDAPTTISFPCSPFPVPYLNELTQIKPNSYIT